MLNDREKDYINSICHYVRCKQAHSCICRELGDHIEDQREAFIAEGMTPEAASEAAVREMGEAELVGGRMDKVYRPRISVKLLAVFAVILAPLVEELVFRKLLCDRMRRYGDKIAVLVSGIAFGLYHGNLYQFFYAAAIGIFFAFLYCRTGRVSYTILLHMLVNFVGSVIPLTVMELCGDFMAMAEGADPFAAAEQMMGMTHEAGASLFLQVMIMGGYGMLLLGGSVAGAIALIICRKQFVCKPGAVMIPKGQGWRALVWNPGSILAVTALLATLVLNTFLS